MWTRDYNENFWSTVMPFPKETAENYVRRPEESPTKRMYLPRNTSVWTPVRHRGKLVTNSLISGSMSLWFQALEVQTKPQFQKSEKLLDACQPTRAGTLLWELQNSWQYRAKMPLELKDSWIKPINLSAYLDPIWPKLSHPGVNCAYWQRLHCWVNTAKNRQVSRK